jgi:hypothetical protein
MKSLYRKKRSWKLRITLALVVIGIILASLWYVFRVISNWFDNHRVQYNQPVKIVLNAPIEIVERKKDIEYIIEAVEELPKLDNLTPIEDYICEKWGVYDCRVALAVARAESGMRADAWNVNSNGSIDIGIFQLNSVHYKKDGCGLADVVDPYKNVDCAYQIWEAQGWTPWVAFTNGSFKGNL